MADLIKWFNTKKALKMYGESVIDLMKEKLYAHDKYASGELIDSLESYVEVEDMKQFLYVSMAEHGQYVDSGRRPGSKRPPISAIEEWIGVRNILPGGRDVRSFAFAIAQNIHFFGIDPVPFIGIFYDNVNKLNELIEDGATEDMEDYINQIVDDFNRNQ